MTNEKEAPEWWRKFITLATGGTYSYVRTEYIPSIVAEAMRRGEVKAWEEAKQMIIDYSDGDTKQTMLSAEHLIAEIDYEIKSLT